MKIERGIKIIFIIATILYFTNCNSSKKSLTAKEIYSMTVNYTVTIITETGLGSGFFEGTDFPDIANSVIQSSISFLRK